MNKTLTIDKIRSVAKTLGRKYSVERISLFGSYARGDATIDSDVDLRLDPGRLKGFFALSGLQLDLQQALGTKVDLLTSDSLDQGFLNHIKPEEIILYEAIQ